MKYCHIRWKIYSNVEWNVFPNYFLKAHDKSFVSFISTLQMSDLAYLNECLKFKQMDIQSQTNINFPVLVPLQHIFRWSAKLFWGLFVFNHEVYGFSKLCTDSFTTCKIILVSQTKYLHAHGTFLIVNNEWFWIFFWC